MHQTCTGQLESSHSSTVTDELSNHTCRTTHLYANMPGRAAIRNYRAPYTASGMGLGGCCRELRRIEKEEIKKYIYKKRGVAIRDLWAL